MAERTPLSAAVIVSLRARGAWPPAVPSAVMIECLTGDSGRDAPANRFLKTCEVLTAVPEALARSAARLRHQAGRGSAVDALVMASAAPDGVVLTTDAGDLRALGMGAPSVRVVPI